MLPTSIPSGDTFRASVALAAYPASAGWVAKLRLVPRAAGGSAIELTAVADVDGAGHLFSATAAATGTWSAGAYTAALWVEGAGGVVSISTSQLTITPNLRTLAGGHDGRSLAAKTLQDLIEARAAFVSSNGRIKSYNINGRQQEFNTAADLDREVTFWATKVAAEEAAAHIAAGGRPRNRILTRYSRPR